MLQQPTPDDYVIATGEKHSVREFLVEVFGHLDLDWQRYVVIDPAFYRPAEVDMLLGDASKARRQLGWQPRVSLRELARMMVESDLQLARREAAAAQVGCFLPGRRVGFPSWPLPPRHRGFSA